MPPGERPRPTRASGRHFMATQRPGRLSVVALFILHRFAVPVVPNRPSRRGSRARHWRRDDCARSGCPSPRPPRCPELDFARAIGVHHEDLAAGDLVLRKASPVVARDGGLRLRPRRRPLRPVLRRHGVSGPGKDGLPARCVDPERRIGRGGKPWARAGHPRTMGGSVQIFRRFPPGTGRRGPVSASSGDTRRHITTR